MLLHTIFQQPAKPQLEIDVDLGLLSGISEQNLRDKARKAGSLLGARWTKFNDDDIRLEDHLSSLGIPVSRGDKSKQAKLVQERNQLRTELVSDIKPILPKAIALSNELIKRFGANDQDAVSLKSILAEFADLADYLGQH